MHLAIIIGTAAGLIHITGYLLYMRSAFTGQSQPNLASWLLWSVLTTANGLSYLTMSGDLVKSVIPIVGSFATVAVFALSLRFGRFKKLDIADKVALAIGAGAVALWWALRSATVANLLLQVCFIISFTPTLRGVWRNSHAERVAPWFTWCVADLFSIIVIILRWRGQYQDLASPISGVIMSTLVILFTFHKQKNRQRKRA